MYLADETWPDLDDYVAPESLALVPLGSTEQHGPHLPLATDHLIAEALAREAADRTGYLCTPTVNVGVSPHHRQFHGTMWVDPPQFRDYVESMTRNLAYHGIDRVVFVNAHGGNVQHLREVGRRLRDDGTMYAIEWMWDESIPDLVTDLFDHPGPHGGPKETAMIHHLRSELVRDDRLDDARDGGSERRAARRSNTAHGPSTTPPITPTTAFSATRRTRRPRRARRCSRPRPTSSSALWWLDAQAFDDLLPRPRRPPTPGCASTRSLAGGFLRRADVRWVRPSSCFPVCPALSNWAFSSS